MGNVHSTITWDKTTEDENIKRTLLITAHAHGLYDLTEDQEWRKDYELRRTMLIVGRSNAWLWMYGGPRRAQRQQQEFCSAATLYLTRINRHPETSVDYIRI